MTGFEVYQMYLSLKLHFSKDSYDYFKFQGKTKASQQSFDKRKDSYFFKKLAVRFERDKIQEYFLSNFVSDNRGYIKEIIRPSGEIIYQDWKSKQENFVDIFKEELCHLLDNIDKPYDQNFDQLFVCTRGRHPILISSYLRKEICLESLIVFECCLGYVKQIDQVLTDPIWKQIKIQILKYSPFLQIDCKEYKAIILNQLKERYTV